MPSLDWHAIAAAVVIGLLIAALLGPLSSRPLAHKALLSVGFAGGWLILVWLWRGNVRLDSPERSLSKAVLVFAACNAALQVADLVIWDLVVGRGVVRGLRVSRLIMHVLGGLALLGAVLLALYNQFPDQASGILVTSTVVSAVLALALQDVLGNVIGGLALEFEAPFHIGDWVRINDFEGEVTGRNWRTTAVRTREHHIVYLTNSGVAKSDVVNLYRPDRIEATDLFVGVAYPHPPGAVKAVLHAAVTATPGVLATPETNIYVHEYADFAVVYRIRTWYDDHWALPRIRDGAMTRIWYHLRRNGMGIPFPIRDVRLTTVPEDAAAQRGAAERDSVTTTLRPLALFAELSSENIARLAAASRRVTFTRGERLVEQGDAGDSLFVIEEGRVRVEVGLRPGGDDDGSSAAEEAAFAGAPVTVAERGPGEYFGELSVLTGEPRSATIVAEAETTVIEVDRAAFASLLRTDPHVA
ncbi:MAG: mechanosensitive ion channel family protein, partial [Ardenticatenales bacterium]